MNKAATYLIALALGLMAPRLTAEPSPPPPLGEGEIAAPEYQVKAAFLFNFAKLTEWPEGTFAGPDTPFEIGVLGTDPFAQWLEQAVAGRKIRGRAIKLTRYQRLSEVQCQLLFISSSENGRLPVILKHLAERRVLTVGDTPAFAARGGMIGLVKDGAEIHFQVNLAAAHAAHLKLSSRLLKLAVIVPGASSVSEE